MPVAFRKPRRLTITVSHHVFESLVQFSDQQGRSLSNYAAFLLESGLQQITREAHPQGHSAALVPVDVQRSAQPALMLRPQLRRRFDVDPVAQAKQPVA